MRARSCITARFRIISIQIRVGVVVQRADFAPKAIESAFSINMRTGHAGSHGSFRRRGPHVKRMREPGALQFRITKWGNHLFFSLQIRGQIQQIKAQIRGQLPPNTRGVPINTAAELVNTGRFFENTQNTVRMSAHAKYIGNSLNYAQIYRSRFYVSRHGSQLSSACYVCAARSEVCHAHPDPTK